MLKRKIVVSLLLPLLLVACTDNDLATVAKSLNAAAKSLTIFQNTIITMNQQGSLSVDTTRSLMNVSLKINEAGAIATATTKKLTALAPSDRTQLLSVLTPVIAAINTALTTDVIQIPNITVRQDVQAGLLAVLTSLNAAQVALEAH